MLPKPIVRLTGAVTIDQTALTDRLSRTLQSLESEPSFKRALRHLVRVPVSSSWEPTFPLSSPSVVHVCLQSAPAAKVVFTRALFTDEH